MLTLICTTVLVFLIYLIVKAWKVNQHWADRKVPHLKPVLFFGNLFDVIVKRRTLDEILQSIYEAFPDEPIVGYYHFMGPRLLIKNQESIERILMTDFSYFMDRGPSLDFKNNPLTANLFGLTGSVWRAVRSKFSPMFTSSKLKTMFPQVENIGDQLVECLQKQRGERVDVRAESKKFAMDVIGCCAFGIRTNTLTEGDNEFSREAILAFKTSLWAFLRVMMSISFPNLSRKLNINFTPQRTIDYFASVIRSALTNRRQSNNVRQDFIQLMLTLKDRGFLQIEHRDDTDDYLDLDNADDVAIEMTDDMLIGQSFVFLLAGFESTSMVMMLVCLDLAANPKCQDKVREEILRVTSEGVTYDNLKNLVYLDRCIKETMRMHSPVGALFRYCVREYEIPGTSIAVNAGDVVMVSVRGVHMDSKLYDQPTTYNPDRWEMEDKWLSTSYLPFGGGPRICIGMRFALMEIKIFAIKFLANYKIGLCSDVELPLKLNPHSFLSTPLVNPHFNLKKL